MNQTTIQIAIIFIIVSTTMMIIAGTLLLAIIQKQQAYASSSIVTTPIPVCPTNTVFQATLLDTLLSLPQGTVLCMVGNQSPQTVTVIPPSGSFLASIIPRPTVSVFVMPATTGTCPAGFQLAMIRSGTPAIPVSSAMCIQML